MIMNSKKATNCETMNIVAHEEDESTCMSRSYVSSSVKKLSTKMTYEEGKAACAAEDMILWMPDNLVDQNKVAAKMGLGDNAEVWLRSVSELMLG